MYATEFKTVINEPYIKVPEYERFKGKEVRVVLLGLNNKLKKEKSSLSFFDKFSKNFPKDFRFDRDEANER